MGLAHPNPNPNPNPNQVGGGKGLSLGKDKVTRMVESFGGRVTGSVSGKTDILLVGKEPGYAKVSQAQSRGGIALLSLEDVRVSLIKGSVRVKVTVRVRVRVTVTVIRVTVTVTVTVTVIRVTVTATVTVTVTASG